VEDLSIRRAAHLGTKAGAARESELNPTFPLPVAAFPVADSESFAAAAEGVNTDVVGFVGGRNILLPGLKTGAAEVEESENAVGVALDSGLWKISIDPSIDLVMYTLTNLLGWLGLIRLGIVFLLVDTVRIHTSLVLESTRPIDQDVSTQPLRGI
jgi:hypothetical protein